MRPYIYYLLCVCMLCSCRTQPSEIFIDKENISNDDCLYLSPPMEKGANNFTNIIDSVWYIPLATNDSTLITRVNEIKFYSDKILIGDYKQGCIFIYNPQGQLINKINNLGEGPEEYKRCCSFEIDTLHNKIYLLDGDLGKVFLYNFDAELEKVISLPYKSVDHIALYNDNYMFLDLGFRFLDKSGVTSNLVLYDLNEMTVKKGFFKFNNDLIKFHNRNNSAFSFNNNNLYYWEPLGNSVYLCGDSLFKKIIDYDLGKYAIPASVYNNKTVNAQKIIFDKSLAHIDLFYELEDWYYSRIVRSRNSAHYFYNKNSQKGFIDLSFLMARQENFISPELYKSSTNTLCGVITSENYSQIIKDENFSVDNNPVLAFYKLKRR